MRKSFAILSILAAGLMSYAAMAQDEVAPTPEGAAPASAAAPAAAPQATPAPAAAPAGYPDEYALRPLVVASGMFQGTLPIVLNLSTSNVLKPVWIPLDLRWGKTKQLEFFVNHGTPGGSVTSGSGVCLGGTSRNCDGTYNNVNLARSTPSSTPVAWSCPASSPPSSESCPLTCGSPSMSALA